MEPKYPQPRAAKWEKILAGEYIPMYSGRPVRSEHIKKDDILDLMILLNTTRTVDAFVAKL